MGLDVYVGRLFTYFNGNWETEGADLYIRDGEKKNGVLMKSNRRSWRSAGIHSFPEALEEIKAWRSALSESLHLQEPLEWREEEESDYYTRQLGWSAYEGLLLWAAYEESGVAPPAYLPEDPYKDSVLLGCQGNIKYSRYNSLLDDTEIWLPGPHSLTFRAVDPTGKKKVDFGFTGGLFDELVSLNERTWRADFQTIIDWSDSPVELVDLSDLPVEQGAPLEACAQFGFAVFFRLAFTARMHELPMVLDY